jgi:hypothetical protein
VRSALRWLAESGASAPQAFAALCAVIGGFSMSAWIELNWYAYGDPGYPNNGTPLMAAYGVTCAATVGLMSNAALLCVFLSGGALAVGKQHVSDLEEAKFFRNAAGRAEVRSRRPAAADGADGGFDSAAEALSPQADFNQVFDVRSPH